MQDLFPAVRGDQLPIGILGADFLVERGGGLVFLVVAKHLTLARCGPVLSGLDALRRRSLNLAQVLDAAARKGDSLARGRNSNAEVILLAHR